MVQGSDRFIFRCFVYKTQLSYGNRKTFLDIIGFIR